LRVGVRHKWSNLLGFLLGASSTYHCLAGCGAARDTVRAQNRIDLANDLLHRGDTSGAEAEIKRALAYDPKNEEAANLYGLVFLVKAQQAEQLLESSDCLRGGDAESIRAEADENMRAAAAHFARASELAPDYGEAWQNRGVAAMHFHDWDKAIEYLNRALERQERLGGAPPPPPHPRGGPFPQHGLPRATAAPLP